MHFLHQFQCFEVFLKRVFDFFKTVFFLKNFVSLYLLRLIQFVFRSIEIAFKIFMESLFVSINRISRIRFLKIYIWLVQTTFSKAFQNFFSLSLRLGKAPQQIFVIFLLISCKVSLSISRYVHIILSFALFFMFSCIISCFLGKFSDYA